MKKGSICVLFCLVICLVFSINVFALEPRSNGIKPSLSFNDSTANCSVTVTANSGQEIDVEMKLLKDGVTVKTWSDSGIGYVYLSERAAVQKGSTYKLIATVSIDGETQPSAWVTKKCE